MAQSDEQEGLRQQLALTMDLLREFLDWRHKVMTRFVVTVGALGIAASSSVKLATLGGSLSCCSLIGAARVSESVAPPGVNA